MSQQNREQQQEHQNYDQEEEYLSAQRAGVEAIMIGRETAATAAQQGEQLRRAEQLADKSQYDLDKAGRILRGMTWTGWMANMVSKAPELRSETPLPPRGTLPKDATTEKQQSPAVYDNLPESCTAAAQAIQNYHANVSVLEACDSSEQVEVCTEICDGMYRTAVQQLQLLETNQQVAAYQQQLSFDLVNLRQRQAKSQKQVRGIKNGTASVAGQLSHNNNNNNKQPTSMARESTMENKPQPGPAPPTVKKLTEADIIMQKQDAHLTAIEGTLGELGSIAEQLQESTAFQNRTIDSLEGKSDQLLETSRMVTRRADRMVQQKKWIKAKPVFMRQVTIRHVATGKYLSIMGGKGDVYLMPKKHHQMAVFRIWKRSGREAGQLIGIQNIGTKQWLGQSIFGNLACNASQFGNRQEWQAADVKDNSNDGDANWTKTRLICASAGWGAGGYIHVRKSDSAVLIGGLTQQQSKTADAWCFESYIDSNGINNSNEEK